MTRSVLHCYFLISLLGVAVVGCRSSAEVEKEYDTLPKLIEHTPPVYPEKFLLATQEAKVFLNIRIDEYGKVVGTSISKSSGDAELDQAALKAVKTWRYLPATKGGKPVPITIRQPIAFTVRAFDTVTFYEIIVSRKELADSLWNLLTGGANFSDLALRFSEAPSAKQGGLRETVRYDALSAIVKITLERLSPEQFSQPFERPDGRFMIVKRK